MDDVKWIKLYIDIFSNNRKIGKLRRLAEGNNLVLIWIMLLTIAGKCNDGGKIYIADGVPYDIEDLADELRFSSATVEKALEEFTRLKMLSRQSSGYLKIHNWDEYQSADKLAEIRAKDRERKRLKKAQEKDLIPDSCDSSTEIPRKFHGNSTDIPHIEEEEEKDKDKEKEFHSFNLSDSDKKIFAENVSPAEEIYLRKRKMRDRFGGKLGENIVILSEEEFDILLENLSDFELEHYFDVIKDMERQGKCYTKKTHFQAIVEMANADRKRIGKKCIKITC